MKIVNIFQYIRDAVGENNTSVAMLQNGASCTYKELFAQVDEMAKVLNEKGLTDFQRVAIFASEGIEYVSLHLCVLSLEGVVIPISMHSKESEVEEILETLDVDVFIFDKNLYKKKYLNESSILFKAGVEFGMVSFQRCFSKQKEFETTKPAFIRFTSGTTGKSKGVVLSHTSIVERIELANKVLNIEADDKVLWVLSMSYHFVVTILLFLSKRATIILSDSNYASRSSIDAIINNEITFIYASPLFYQRLSRENALMDKHMDRVKMAVSTTASLNAPIANAFFEKFGVLLSTAYGIIEVGLPCIHHRKNSEASLSVGKANPPFQVRIEKEDEAGIGQVYVKGPGMFDAYYDPWSLRSTICKDGWFETGDLGRLDEDGYLYLMGRQEQIINFMGMKIFADQVRAVIEEYAGIQEVYVYGEAHESFGQVPKAYIVIDDNENPICLDALRKYCYKKLKGHEVPKEIKIVRSLKKTGSQKIKLEQ